MRFTNYKIDAVPADIDRARRIAEQAPVPTIHIVRAALRIGLDAIEAQLAAGDRSAFKNSTARRDRALDRINAECAALGEPPVPDWVTIRREGGEPAVQAELVRQRAWLAANKPEALAEVARG